VADQSASAEDLAGRVDELEQEVYSLRVAITRVQNAGKTVIGQREQPEIEWLAEQTK
jgi:hypothetical protein